MNSYQFIFSNTHRFRRHFAFWFSWWFLQTLLYSYAPMMLKLPMVIRFLITGFEAFAYLLPHMFLAYSLMYFVVPGLLLRSKYFSTVVSVVALFILTAAISAFIGVLFLQKMRIYFFSKNFLIYTGDEKDSFFLSLLAGLRGSITIGGLAAAIKLMKILYSKEQRNLQLQKENVESQLQLLKAQVHPHFLFNTLNNIYSHTKNVSPVGSQLVLGLSDLLRSILYECRQEYIAVDREIEMLRNYIMLEKIRYGNKLDVSIDIGHHKLNLEIAPLLLLPFVENAFKHGTSQVIEQPWMGIYIRFGEQNMHVRLLNGKSPRQTHSDLYSGIGIHNVRRRLELLYPAKHTLTISDQEEVFIVDLRLELQEISKTKNNISINNRISALA